MLPKEALKFEKDAQLLEKVIVKDNESLERALMSVEDMSDNMIDYVNAI